MKVYKRDGKEVDFCLDKIKTAIEKANRSTFSKYRKEIDEASRKEAGKVLDYKDLLAVTDDGYSWDLPGSKERLVKEASRYILVDGALEKVIETTQKFLKPFSSATVEDISDLVEKALMKNNAYEVAKEYILYRDNKKKNKKFTDDEEKVLSVIDGTNEELRGDNANKRIDVNSAARDYIAGILCKSIASKMLPKDVLEAHSKKLIHFHDMDYSPVMHEYNCCLYNLEDMLDNGFCMNDIGIKTPRRFSTAANLAAQTNLIVSSLQYGGQTFTWTALAKYVERTRKDVAVKLALSLGSRGNYSHCGSADDIYREYRKEMGLRALSRGKFRRIVESEVKSDIHVGIKTYQFQCLCHTSSQGQTPFVSNVLNLREAQDEQEQKDLAFIIEEVLKRRIKGVTDKNGKRMAPLFPKLLYYVCEGLNKEPGDPYYYLTELAAKCMTTSMQPDIISEKMNRLAKKGQMVPNMGCRSFPFASWIERTYPADHKFHWQNTTDKNVQYDGAPGKNFDFSRGLGIYSELPKSTENVIINVRGNSAWVKSSDESTVTIIEPKVYGRFNMGVVTVNIPHAALTARKAVNERHGLKVEDFDGRLADEYRSEFYAVFSERLALCHKALLCRWDSIKRIKAKNSPLLFMHGAIARLPEEANIGDWVASHSTDYTSISLGYIGLYETCRALIGDTNTSEKGQELSKEILEFMNMKAKEWTDEDHLGYSIYGTPEEALTGPAAQALKRDFGLVDKITDHDYVTNSYHVNPAEPIDAFNKLRIEGQYLQLSPGGAVSYIEVPDMKSNPKALESVIRYMYDNIMYAEVNTKIDTCWKCGYQGELEMVKSEGGKFLFRCPKCGSTDPEMQRVTRRLCGYIGLVNSGNTNKGRLADIYDRVLHL